MSEASDPHVSAERERELIAAARRDAAELAKLYLPSLPPAGSIPGYTLVRELGRGGMGIVYEAKQQQTQRAVALKMITAGGFVDDRRVRLFAREIQTLARLRHPAIATIYEAGRTDNGHHFFAMELVRGVPLTEYVGLGQPPLRDRLQLFGRICEAIHYAHQRGVIHRDLKPSNIIIDAQGHPKILDFGLARITDLDVTISTTSTEIGKIMGTLPYMSPEQARGRSDEIDVRSDVYSLGVILYELLTGQLPYGLDATAPHEFLRIICEQTPRRPSTVSRALRGDLETIVLKALAKDPSRRYRSAAALGEDTDRYLMRQPILARPPSTAYQLRKLVARHKLASAFVAALSVLVAGFGIWMSVLYAEADAAHAAERGQRRLAEANLAHAQEAERRAAAEAARAKRERDRAVGAEQLAAQRLSESKAAQRQAERQRENAQRIQEFLEGTIASADPYSSPGAPAFRDMLDGAAERVETAFAEQPAAAASIHDTLGLAYARAGWYEPAEHHLRAALALRQQLFGDEHLDVADSLAHLSFSLSHCRWLGNPHRDPHEYEEALALCERALAIRRRLLGEYHARTLQARAYLGYLHHWAGDFAAADEAMITVNLMGLHSQVGTETIGQLLGQALRVIRACSPAHDFAVAEEMAHALMHAGLRILRGLWSSGQHEAARGFVRLFYGPFIIDPVLGEAVSWIMALFAERRMLCGDYDTAEPILLEAIEASRARFGAGAQFYVAWNLENLALVLRARGDLPEAEGLLREVLAMRRALPGGNHPQVAVTLERLAGVLMEQRNFAAAETLFRECRDIRRGTFGPTHWLTAYTESLLGECLSRLGRYELAEPLLVESYPFIRDDRGERHERTVEALNRIVDLYEALGEAEKAAEYRAMLPEPPG